MKLGAFEYYLVVINVVGLVAYHLLISCFMTILPQARSTPY